MLRAKIIRTQHAIGHGGFHTGLISTEQVSAEGWRLPGTQDVARFSYVYDCGSEKSDAFNAELSLYRTASGGSTDLLFVSHLHADHINGIDRLQAMAPPKTVIVPYLDVVERLLFVLSDFERGDATRSSLDYLRDPGEWWLSRGAERVIFIEQGRRDDLPPAREARPDGPIDDAGPGRRVRLEEASEKQPSSRLASYLKATDGTTGHGLQHPDPAVRELESGAFIAASGSYFQLEWQHTAADTWRRGDWILLPYVHPVDGYTRKRFLKEAKKAIGYRGGDDHKLTKALIETLRSSEDTKALVEIYNRHFVGGHNAISMSLYSGPLSRRQSPPSTSGEPMAWRSFLEEPSYGSLFWSAESYGWLGTGDAALRDLKWRTPWKDFFTHFTDRIAILTLPHHGSANNFHPDILEIGNLHYALATTVEARNRVARLRETLGTVESKGIRTRVVDDQRLNRFSIVCDRVIS